MLIGGLGSIYGAMVGGLILGIVEVLSVAYLESVAARCVRIRPDDPDPDRSPERPVPDRNQDGTLTMLGGYWESVAIFMGINCLMGISLYIPMTAGLISLGQGGFMAIGAYVCALLTKAEVPFARRAVRRRLRSGLGGHHCRYARAADPRHLRDDLDARLWRDRSRLLCQLRADRRRVRHGRHPTADRAVAGRAWPPASRCCWCGAFGMSGSAAPWSRSTKMTLRPRRWAST